MILKALLNYYEQMAQKGKIPRSGWGKVKIQYALEIDGNGKLISIMPIGDTDEKGKTIPRPLELPAPQKRSVGIAPNFLWDNAAYMLGVDSKGNKKRALECFQSAKELHVSLLSEAKEPFGKAVCAFFEKWEPEYAETEQNVTELLDSFAKGANITFMYNCALPDSDSELARIWQNHYDRETDNSAGKMRCLVTGEETVPVEIHPAIKGVNGAQSSGAALVSFNAPAFCSYGREQNINAPVSKYAAFAYTTALNSLIEDKKHRKLIGNTTVVYWAETAEEQYQDIFGCMLDGDSITDDDINSVMEQICSGKMAYWDGLPVNPSNHFYVLGIAPNAARLSVRFFLSDSFGNFAENIIKHYERLKIVRPEFDKDELLPLWKLLRETVNPKSNDKSASPQMAGDTLSAILSGTNYPATLFQQTMLRIRAEHDISRGKAAIIKAYLIKNYNREDITVELNEKTDYQPYVMGRLFSVLEAIQQKANPGINTTIKDKYFTSAAATPAVVFPILLNLAQKHLRKMDDGSRIWYSKQLGELIGMMTASYPAHLSLNDQGIFQIGYYHQNQKRFEKKNNNIEEDK